MEPPLKTDGKYYWTSHSLHKIRHYQLSQSRIKRIIRNPFRTEQSIVEEAIGVMQPSQIKTKDGLRTWKEEIWVMYAAKKTKIYIISAWRYPGISDARDPVPSKILKEIQSVLHSFTY